MFGLKRFTLRTKYHSTLKPNLEKMFISIRSITIQEQFMTSPKEFLVLCNIEWKKTPHENDEMLDRLIRDIDWFDEIIPIDTQKKRTLCFIKGHHDPAYTELFLFAIKEYLCFIEFPIIVSEECGTFNIIGPPKEISRLIEFMREWGSELEIIGTTPYFPRDRGVLSVLTEKQLSTLKQAHTRGFFDSPRKRDARSISKEMGIRHTTFLTHLRRGQKRIFSYLFQS